MEKLLGLPKYAIEVAKEEIRSRFKAIGASLPANQDLSRDLAKTYGVVEVPNVLQTREELAKLNTAIKSDESVLLDQVRNLRTEKLEEILSKTDLLMPPFNFDARKTSLVSTTYGLKNIQDIFPERMDGSELNSDTRKFTEALLKLSTMKALYPNHPSPLEFAAKISNFRNEVIVAAFQEKHLGSIVDHLGDLARLTLKELESK